LSLNDITTSDEATVREHLKSRFEATFEERVQRALDMRPQVIVPDHHFTWASTECVYLYRDGYFMATAMATQALNEGLIRFVAERSGIAPNQELNTLVDALLAQKMISNACADAMRQILRSFRNDFHHLNPSISKVPVQEIAKRNIEDIAVLEKEIFDHTFHEGKLIPKQPKYWDVNANGTTLASIRFG
jgi:hypothetical protein